MNNLNRLARIASSAETLLILYQIIPFTRSSNQLSSGAKGYAMSLDRFFQEIETIEFQVQYSIFSGFNLVLSAMSEDELLRQLMDLLVQGDDKQHVRDVAERIELLLQEYELGVSMPIDESIAAYLYCLWKVDPATALEASKIVLDAGGQWWSVQLALHILQLAQTETA